ncbi:MAG: hypothetical protein ABEI74_02630 [Candidatus Pacearchaeota archaeon]
MDLKNKILPYIFAGSILAGAGSINKAEAQSSSSSQKVDPTMKQVESEIGHDHYSMINFNMPGGYVASKPATNSLQTAAGIYAGTIDVKEENGKYLVSGTYSQAKHPEAMEKALRKADTNNTGVVTWKEANKFTRNLLEKKTE